MRRLFKGTVHVPRSFEPDSGSNLKCDESRHGSKPDVCSPKHLQGFSPRLKKPSHGDKKTLTTPGYVRHLEKDISLELTSMPSDVKRFGRQWGRYLQKQFADLVFALGRGFVQRGELPQVGNVDGSAVPHQQLRYLVMSIRAGVMQRHQTTAGRQRNSWDKWWREDYSLSPTAGEAMSWMLMGHNLENSR